MNSQANQSYTAYQYQIIKELKDKIADLNNQIEGSASSKAPNDTKVRYWGLPYVFEITNDNKDEVEADEPIYLYIRDDDSKGLKVPAQNGYIKNDGPGNISYRLNNGSNKGWSHPATLKTGEIDTFDYHDNIQIAIVEITVDTNKTKFRTRFTPGFVKN